MDRPDGRGRGLAEAEAEAGRVLFWSEPGNVGEAGQGKHALRGADATSNNSLHLLSPGVGILH
jgi:hypothetical protein